MSEILSREEFVQIIRDAQDESGPLLPLVHHDKALRDSLAKLQAENAALRVANDEEMSIAVRMQTECDSARANVTRLREAMTDARWIDSVIRDICELPDRDSPEGFPEAMIVTPPELTAILRNRMRATLAGSPTETPNSLREAAQAFLDKVTECGKVIDGIIGVQTARGYPYTGPNWATEHATLTTVLAGSLTEIQTTSTEDSRKVMAFNLLLTSVSPSVRTVAKRHLEGVENYGAFVEFLKTWTPTLPETPKETKA